MPTFDTIAVEHEANGVVTLTLNRPDKLNAVTETMLGELDDVVARLNADPSLKVVILTGAGRAFCAGRDLGELASARAEQPALPPAGGYESSMFRSLQVPCIAAINGVAIGVGLGFALQCDLRVASRDATLVDGHLRNSMVPSVAAWYVPRLVGTGRALQFFCAPKGVSAEEARALGLVDAVVSGDELLGEARRLAAPFTGWDAGLLRHTKRLVDAAVDRSYQQTMELVGLLRTMESRRPAAVA